MLQNAKDLSFDFKEAVYGIPSGDNKQKYVSET